MMRNLKILLCILTVLCLPVAALAAPGDAYLFSSDQKQELDITDYGQPSMGAIGSTVYSLWGPDVYAWDIGDDAPRLAAGGLPYGYYQNLDEATKELGDDAVKMINMLMSDGEALYGLNTMNGLLYPLTLADGQAVYGAPVALDWSQYESYMDNGDYLEFVRTAITDGTLYMLVRSYDDYKNPMFSSFDLASGEQTSYDVSHLQDIAPYRDGKLLVQIFDYETAYDQDTGEMANPTLSVFDPASGAVTDVGFFGNANVYGIVYDEANDTLYYTTNSMLMAMPALADARQVAYIPVDYAGSSSACLLPGGLYAIDMWNGLIVRNTDPQFMPAVALSIYGGYMDEASIAFSAEYPDIPLTFNTDSYYSTASGMAQAMASGDSANDVYSISMNYMDFGSLMDKGYCMDLSGYPALTDALQGLYPFLKSAVTNADGEICAVPTYMYAYGLSIMPDVWKEAGLEDRMPTSFMGLIDFFQWYLDEGMDEYPDLILIQDVYDYGSTLMDLALNLYITQYQAEGKELTLDTPEFRDMMEGIESLDIEALNDTAPITQEEMMYADYYEDYSDVSLFSQYGDWLSAYASNYQYMNPLILSIEDGGARYIPVRVQCMFINPNSPSADMAAAYLLNSLEKMEPTQHVMMFPEDNDPIPNEYYKQMVEDYESLLLTAQNDLLTANPEDAKQLQASIDGYEDFLSHKDDYYWTASPQSIAAYREMVPMCYTATPNVLSYGSNEEGTSEIMTLIDRYVQKQMTLDQFITQADQKIRMIQLEMQ